MTAMREGRIARIEELTRIPSDVQDALITILSEKTLPMPELGTEVQAAKGFNVIATANDRDRGVNELSSALRRRFNTVVLPLPAERGRGGRRSSPAGSADLGRGAGAAGGAGRAGGDPPGGHGVPRAAVRGDRGRPDQAQVAVRARCPPPRRSRWSPTGSRWPRTSATACCAPADVAAGIVGAVVKDPVADSVVWTEYLEAVVRERAGWADFYRACREVSG